ncbi:hypothetical protein [Halobacteriovorax sp. DPLXC-1]|uniref:hypothetical protein n=1 Tax=Halobacteriovorax sp. DPLXC-1 TaxID=3110771 RepID=UPI002FF3E671
MNLKYYKHTFIIHSVACNLLLSSYNVYAGKEAAFEFLNYGLQTLIGPEIKPDSKFVKELKSRNKKELNGKIDITFNIERVNKCKKLKLVKKYSSYSRKPLFSNNVYCEIDYKPLTDEVLKAGGNVLFINNFSDKCDISTYQSYAYSCDKPSN